VHDTHERRKVRPAIGLWTQKLLHCCLARRTQHTITGNLARFRQLLTPFASHSFPSSLVLSPFLRQFASTLAYARLLLLSRFYNSRFDILFFIFPFLFFLARWGSYWAGPMSAEEDSRKPRS
jgi:hypothetical protein